MALNENDIELLHAYLDGEMPTSECEGLWRRLAVEPDLAAELDRLRADAMVRAQVWSSLEPDDASAVRLETSILRTARRDALLSGVVRSLRIAVAAAACLLFGFTVGWFGREGRLNGTGSSGGMQLVSNPGAAASTGYTVDVRDDQGHVIAAPHFASFDRARSFEDYLLHQADAQETTNATVVPAVDHF